MLSYGITPSIRAIWAVQDKLALDACQEKLIELSRPGTVMEWTPTAAGSNPLSTRFSLPNLRFELAANQDLGPLPPLPRHPWHQAAVTMKPTCREFPGSDGRRWLLP